MKSQQLSETVRLGGQHSSQVHTHPTNRDVIAAGVEHGSTANVEQCKLQSVQPRPTVLVVQKLHGKTPQIFADWAKRGYRWRHESEYADEYRVWELPPSLPALACSLQSYGVHDWKGWQNIVGEPLGEFGGQKRAELQDERSRRVVCPLGLEVRVSIAVDPGGIADKVDRTPWICHLPISGADLYALELVAREESGACISIDDQLLVPR